MTTTYDEPERQRPATVADALSTIRAAFIGPDAADAMSRAAAERAAAIDARDARSERRQERRERAETIRAEAITFGVVVLLLQVSFMVAVLTWQLWGAVR